jgi:hypothetical protein
MRTVVAACLAIALALPPTSFGQDVDKYLGTWVSTGRLKLPDNVDRQQLKITRDAKGLHLDSVYYRDEVVVVTSVGVDVKVDGSNVVFLNNFEQIPSPAWKSNKDHLGLRFQGEVLEWINVDRKNKHVRSFRREPVVADLGGPKPAPKVDPKENAATADPYVGVWKGSFPGSDKTILLKIAGSDATGYTVEGIAIGDGGSVVGRFPALDADRKPKGIQVDVAWAAFAGATLTGGARFAIDREASNLGLAAGSNRSVLTAAADSEFAKLRTR